MQLIALGINYRSTSLMLRERFAISDDKLGHVLKKLKYHITELFPSTFAKEVEVMVLSTCNRTEVYLALSEDVLLDFSFVFKWLADYVGVDEKLILPYVYLFYKENAVKHVFRVVSGLDSMVLGEPQILGQVKLAFKKASESGTTGLFLHRLFEHSFATEKAVRSQTEISRHSISIASAIVKIAKRIFNSLEKKKILFIGAGQMIELCLRHFLIQNGSNVTIANRDLLKAERLAANFHAHAILLLDLPNQLHEFDIVISCTASTNPIVTLDMFKQALLSRSFLPVLVVDLAVPRDIEAEVSQLKGIHAYTVDDLNSIVSASNVLRQASVAQAEEIIHDRTK